MAIGMNGGRSEMEKGRNRSLLALGVNFERCTGHGIIVSWRDFYRLDHIKSITAKMAITAKQVNELRKATGAGMMDCKKALVEAEGDFDKAVEILRKKGQKVSAKRSDREANEGSVFAFGEGAKAVLIELNCETDFVARNDDFQELGGQLASAAYNAAPADLEGLLAVELEGRSISDHLTDAMGKIGEKITISKYQKLEAEGVVTYIHPGGRVGVGVAFDGIGSADLVEIGKNVAMQIAAMNPVAIDKDGVPQDIIDKEMEIVREQALASGKPAAIVDKIATGKLNKFFKENTLLNQEFVKDTSKTIAQYLKEANPDLTVKAFSRLQLGAN